MNTDWKLPVKTTLEYLLNTMDVSHKNALDCLNGLIAISQDEKITKLLKEAISEIEDYDDESAIEVMLYCIASLGLNEMKFGWWYIRYQFAYEPWASFGVFEDEYKKQFNCEEISTLEMVEIYSDYSENRMPKGLIPDVISAIAYIVFRIRHRLHNFVCRTKAKLSFVERVLKDSDPF